MRFHIYGANPSKLVTEDESSTFDSLGLNEPMCQAIQSMAIREPSAIQKATIPSILEHKNVICSAETGSGKTIAYMAPILQMIREYKEITSQETTRGFPLGLVVVPSRELAEQVGRVAHHLGTHCGIGVSTMIGGLPKHLTHSGMDLIVSTIGLVQPLLQRRKKRKHCMTRSRHQKRGLHISCLIGRNLALKPNREESSFVKKFSKFLQYINCSCLEFILLVRYLSSNNYEIS